MKVQCKVCIESPIIELPDIEEANDGQEVYCPSCEKWIATANIDEWVIDYMTFENLKLIPHYPVKIIEY